jgi:acyl-CoA reductase-like NAD-dependent aldehyde dehydrogenase
MKVKSLNPDQPSDVVIEFESASEGDVMAAVQRAKESFRGWSQESALVRGKTLHHMADRLMQRSDDLVPLVVREVGKPVAEARGEVARAVAILRYFAQMILGPDGETYPSADGRSLLWSRRFPVGVAGLVTPWNFPVAIPIWKLAPAIGYGNTVVLKPASAGSAIALLLHEVISEELPSGTFELLLGNFETGDALVGHPDVSAVSFTGSVAVGNRVAQKAAARGARFQCEMGGKNASIVLADADLKSAVATIVQASMGYAGQKCTATSRIIVEESVYEKTRELLVEAIGDLSVLDPSEENCSVGPVIDASARNEALRVIKESSGRILIGGNGLESTGFYVAPTLVEVDSTDLLAQEEVFAPVAALISARDAAESVQIANAVQYGLVASVFTSKLSTAVDFLSQLEVGMVRVNAPTSGVDFHTPFGGSKASSVGPREQGLAARDLYTESRTIQITA